MSEGEGEGEGKGEVRFEIPHSRNGTIYLSKTIYCTKSW